MAKVKQTVKVVSQERLADGVYSMWIETREIASQAKAGQFISVYSKDGAKLLPRPISLCEIDKELGRLRIVYRVVGGGTEEFSSYQAGDDITILGPLGNGFPLQPGKTSMVIGGGIGVPPMVQTARELSQMAGEKGQVLAVMGYRDSGMFLKEELSQVSELYIATEDGSFGTKGNVMNAIEEQGLEADVIYACGPTPMLRAIKAYALEHQIECYLSLEEKMACGVGACLACVCQSKDVDHHSHVHNKRICKDGPVFRAEEVEL